MRRAERDVLLWYPQTRSDAAMTLWGKHTAASIVTIVAVFLGGRGGDILAEETLIFADEFDTFDLYLWNHLVTAWRGGNKEFEYYRNDRRNSYVRDGVLYIRPTLTAIEYGNDFLYNGSLSYKDCNKNPCASTAETDIVLPIQSARIRTEKSFGFRYGRVEVRAKMPRGDWLWPAIWLKPVDNAYGPWPASGEIDLVECRGNRQISDANGQPQGVQRIATSLHFGPNTSYNVWWLAHWQKTLRQGDFGDGFHVYSMEWSDSGFSVSVDGVKLGSMPAPKGGFWTFGGFDKNPGGPNIWAKGNRMAPFDKEFYLIINVAVGGTFFPNNFVNKPFPRPWNWTSSHPMRDFWENRNWWLKTWKGEDAALQVDYVRVYQKNDI